MILSGPVTTLVLQYVHRLKSVGAIREGAENFRVSQNYFSRKKKLAIAIPIKTFVCMHIFRLY